MTRPVPGAGEKRHEIGKPGAGFAHWCLVCAYNHVEKRHDICQECADLIEHEDLEEIRNDLAGD